MTPPVCDRPLVGAVILGCPEPFAGMGIGPAVTSRLARLSALGIHVVLVGRPLGGGADGHLGVRPRGPGRLFAWDGGDGADGAVPDVVEIGADGSTVGRGPVLVPDALAWVRTRLLSERDPETVLVLDAGAPRGAMVEATNEESGGTIPVLAALDGVVDAHSRFPVVVADVSWRLDVECVDPLRERDVESWLTIANGRCGTRGSLEEGRAESSPAMYVAGVFGRVEGELPGPELVRGPEWTRLHPRVGDEEVGLDHGEILEHRRLLDLRQGIVFRTWRQRLPSGQEWRFRSVRFASMADRHVLVLEAEARSDGSPVTLAGEVPVSEEQGPVAGVEARTDGDRSTVVVRARDGASARFVIRTNEDGGRLTRLVTIGRGPDDEPEEGLARAEADGLATLRARHRLAWRDRWRAADVVVRGDDALQRAVRFALYHLISSGDPESDLASVGARGLTGPGYLGHVFWDTDVFAMPFFTFTHPPTARALLAYRHRTLPAARAKARRLGYGGALYAWESADTGEETTPLFAWRADGTRVDILCGSHEHHISADVAWATWRYWKATGDDAFLVDMGAEIVFETARFWASRASSGSDGRYHIACVIGPDEYHEGVDDNAFTNVLARWNLRAAIELCDVLPALDGGAWGRLRDRLSLRATEPERWQVVADRLVDGFDENSLLYEQFAGFFSLEDVRAVDLAPRPFTGDTLLGPERARRAQMVKQADVLMLAHMLPDEIPAEVVQANYRYYEPRTSHGSSLSPPVHASVAARVGALDDADRYFRMAAAMDLDDRMGNAAQGVHLATMGGLWQAAVFGFGGVRPEGDALRVDPRLPCSWEGLAFPLLWRGTRVEVDVGQGRLRIDVDRPVTIGVGAAPPRLVQPGRVVFSGPGWRTVETTGALEGTGT